jgi:DNA-directed RNA polymerase specialized sigma24 family protein
VIDELRDRVKYQQEQEGRELTAFSDKGALPPDRIVTDRDELNRAMTALAAANPQARDVILLRYEDEYTVDEIAGRLSISLAVVYALIRTASEFLEGALGYQGDFQT